MVNAQRSVPAHSVDFDLTGTVALVTGATKGIGYGVVRQMLRAGAKVALTSRTAADCDAVSAELDDEFGDDRSLGVAWDLADLAGLPRMIDIVLDRWGRIDAAVCNAADTGQLGTVDSVTAEGFAQLLQTNVVHNFVLARTLARAMVVRGHGSITLITSIAATTPMPSNVPYAAAKAGMLSMARSLAGEYAGTGVRVNCVAPGLIRSYSSRAVWQNEEFERAFVGANIPMQRIGEAEEVGSACVFLASTAGAYITAASIPVDGGRAGLGQITGGPDLTKARRTPADR